MAHVVTSRIDTPPRTVSETRLQKDLDKDGFPRPENMAQEITEARNGKSLHYRRWDLALNVLAGFHDVVLSNDRTRWVIPDRRRIPRRRKVNLTLNLYRNTLAALQVQTPHFAVSGGTPSTDDISKARISQMALHHWFHRERIVTRANRLNAWLASLGNGGIWSFWDPDAKRIRTEAVSPYDIFFEDGVDDPERSSWLALRQYATLQNLHEQGETHLSGAALDQWMHTISKLTPARRHYANEDLTGHNPPPRYEMYDIWFHDGSWDFGRRRHVILVGDQYLWKDETPDSPVPLEFMRYTELPKEPWGIGMVWPIIDSQRDYNDLRHQISKTVKMMANPKWLVDIASGVNPRQLNDEVGGIVIHHGPKPEQVVLQGLPNYAMDHQVRIVSDMQSSVGRHSTSLGQRAVGVESGKHVQQLAAMDATQLEATLAQVKSGFQRHAKAVLALMKEHWTRAKTRALYDEYGRLVHDTMKGTQIVDDPEVIIDAHSFFKHTALEKERQIRMDVQIGLMDPIEARSQIQMRSWGKEQYKKTMGLRAAKETLEALKGNRNEPNAANWVRAEVMPFDDLESIIEVFHEYMQSPDYREIPEPLQEYLRDWILDVYQLQQQTQMQMMGGQGLPPTAPGAMATPAAGSPGPGPGGRSPSTMNPEEGLSHRSEALASLPHGGGM